MQELLAADSSTDAALDVLTTPVWHTAPDGGSGVVLGLQQAGHVGALEVEQRNGLGLEADVRHVLGGQVIGTEPAAARRVTGQVKQFVSRRDAYRVQVQERA